MSGAGVMLRRSVIVCALLACASAGGLMATPHRTMARATVLGKTVPSQFGDWKEMPNGLAQMALSVTDGERTEEQPYDEVVMRTYANGKGERVMLALAYAREQRQEVKIHRPEVCYVAQGYKLVDEQQVDMPQLGGMGGQGVHGQRLLMNSNNQTEAVSYWIRVGDFYPRGGLNTRMAILQHGFKGMVPDAILVRASSILGQPGEAAGAYERQESFLAQLVQAMRPADATMLVAANK